MGTPCGTWGLNDLMTTAAGAAYVNAGLTVLSEDEEMFRASVREFAEGEVRPKVERMEHAGKLDRDLIKQCFELGLMAIESPEEYGGAGSTIFNAIHLTQSKSSPVSTRASRYSSTCTTRS